MCGDDDHHQQIVTEPLLPQLIYAGRRELGSVAVGIGPMHTQEVENLVADTFHS